MANLYVSESWLAEANDRYRQRDIPHKQRAFRAWRELSVERQIPLTLGSPIVREIFDWFSRHAPSAATSYGELFRFPFFFDAVFWPIAVPTMFGTVRLAPFEMLPMLPNATHAALAVDRPARGEYLSAWSSVVDWVLSFEDLYHATARGFADQLLAATKRKLVSASHELLSGRPSADAAQSAAFAIELATKRLLVVRKDRTQPELKAAPFGHNLTRLLEECSDLLPPEVGSALIERVRGLPSISARYTDLPAEPQYLWQCYLTALVACAACIRVETGRDIAASLVEASPPENPAAAADV